MSADRIIEWLRQQNALLGPHRQAIIRTTVGDGLVDWSSFRSLPQCGLPGIPVGQAADYRYATDQEDGLHVHMFADGRIELHLDMLDGCKSPLAHSLAETELVTGALAGLALGALLALLSQNPHYAVTFLGAGAVAGGAIGAHIPRREPIFYELAELIGRPTPPRDRSSGDWMLDGHQHRHGIPRQHRVPPC